MRTNNPHAMVFTLANGTSNSGECENRTVRTDELPIICSPPPAVTTDDLRGHLHLAGLKLAEEPSTDPFNEEIDVLIGLDYMQDVIDGKMKKGETGPVAMGSRFGWILAGRSGDSSTQSAPSLVNFIRTESPGHLLEDLWNMESIGISSKGACDSDAKKELEELAMKHFEDACSRLPDGRYEVHWPWKPETGDMPSNEAQAKARLADCEKQLWKNGRIKQYDDAIQDYLDNGHAERAPAVPSGPVQSVRYVCTPATTWRNDRDRNARDGPFWVGEVQCDRVTAVSSVGGEGAGGRGGETRRHGTWRAEGGPPLR